MYRRLKSDTISVQTMIDILDCDVKTLAHLDGDELDTEVSFMSNYCGIDREEYLCTLREIKYTYEFCKRFYSIPSYL